MTADDEHVSTLLATAALSRFTGFLSLLGDCNPQTLEGGGTCNIEITIFLLLGKIKPHCG